MGAGNAGEEDRTPAEPQQPDTGGDKANEEYARKATDLALEYLKDQLAKDKLDQELLDKLQWSRDDMQRFVEHWEKMKSDAQVPGEAGSAARKRLDESLRGLGLRPRSTTLESGASAQDVQRQLRESRRTAPPAEYADQVKTYKQRLAKGVPQK
jgi:hypothetical protein